MNNTKELIAEQKKEPINPLHISQEAKNECDTRHTTSLKSLLLALREGVEEIQSCYPEDIFSEPWEGWEKDIGELAKSKGMALDNVSACYGRWQEKVMKERVSTLITEVIKSLEE